MAFTMHSEYKFWHIGLPYMIISQLNINTVLQFHLQTHECNSWMQKYHFCYNILETQSLSSVTSKWPIWLRVRGPEFQGPCFPQLQYLAKNSISMLLGKILCYVTQRKLVLATSLLRCWQHRTQGYICKTKRNFII